MNPKVALSVDTTEERVQTVVATAPISLFAFDHAGMITLSEGNALDDLGLKPGQLIGQSIFDVYRGAPNLEANVFRALAGAGVNFTTVANGLFCDVHFIPFVDRNGEVASVTGVAYNIMEQKRAEFLLAGEKRLLEMVASGCSLKEVLEALCRSVEETASGCYCGVMLVDSSGSRLNWVAAPSLPVTFTEALQGSQITVDACPCAMATYLNKQVITADVASETRWKAQGWCQLALSHGLRACWSTPILSSSGKVLGSFAILYSEPRAPSPFHHSLIERFTQIASIAVERAQSDAVLEGSEARKTAILDSALDCIVTIDHEGRITEFNTAAERVFGYRRAEVVGKQLADVIVPPSLRGQHRHGFARYLATGEARVLGRRVEMTAVRADGSEFPVELAITRIPVDGPASFTGCLRDISKRKQSEESLRASEQVARGQVEALTFSLDVLATASEPEKFIGKMLGAICRLMNAQCAILWLLDETNESLILRAWMQGANFQADPEHPFIKDPSSWKKDPGLKQMFFAGVPIASEDVEHDPHISSDLREYFLSHGTRTFLRIPTLAGGHVRGFIGIRHESRHPYRPGEVELAQALAHQVMLAIQLTELGEQNRQAAVLAERNRMARDIHDTLAQGFTAIVVHLQAAEDASARGLKKDAQKHLRSVRDLARQSLVEARRSVHALRPQALEDTSFWEALKGMIKQSTVGTELHTKFQIRGHPRELPPLWQQNLLHIGQEALTNTLKYAHAGRFEARLNFNKKELRLELEDDGEGFTATDRHDGFGLIGMRERVEQMGGTLTVTSSRDQGTRVVVVSAYPN